MNKYACATCGEIIETLGTPMKCNICKSTLKFNLIEEIIEPSEENISAESHFIATPTPVVAVKEDTTQTTLDVVEEPPIPEIVEEIVEEPKSPELETQTKGVVEEMIDENPTNILGFNAKPQIFRDILNIVSLPKGSVPFFTKIVLNKDSKRTIYNGIGDGGTLISHIEIDNTLFNENWGIGKISFDSKSSLEYVGMLGKHNEMSIDLNNETGILMFYSGENDKIARSSENPSSIDTSSVKCPIPLEYKTLYENIDNETDDNKYEIPVLGGDNKFDNYFDVKADEIKSIITRTSKFGISQYTFGISPMGINIGVGDITNPEKGAFKTLIQTIHTSENLPTLNIQISDILSNVIDNVDGIIRFNFTPLVGNPIWITGEIFNDKNVKKGSYGFLLPVLS